MKIKLGLLAIAALTAASTYATCYIYGDCVCAVTGNCYGSKPLPDCNVPTSIIAETSATTWNACAGPGPYTGRQSALAVTPCCPAACRAWDACTHQYVQMTGSLCCFNVTVYDGVGSGCN